MYHRFTIVYYLVKNISADNSRTITTKLTPSQAVSQIPAPNLNSPLIKNNGKKNVNQPRDFFPKYSSCKLSVNTWVSLY